MWFVLFALSPCVVKELLFSAANVEYVQPPNKAKTTAPTSSCPYSQNYSQQISLVKQTNRKKQIEPVGISENLFLAARSVKIQSRHSENFSGSSPPKYILYKRLKLLVV